MVLYVSTQKSLIMKSSKWEYKCKKKKECINAKVHCPAIIGSLFLSKVKTNQQPVTIVGWFV